MRNLQAETVVEIEGCDGSWFTIAGPNAGDRGVWLGTGVKGLYDPPVQVTEETPGNWPGARYLNHRVLKRDVVFKVEILHEECDTWMSRESEWRKAWSFDKDTKMHITTRESGTRTLKLRLFESPEVDWETDPTMKTVNSTVMSCVAYDPFWWSTDDVHTATCAKDTSFNPVLLNLPWPWPKKLLPWETLTIDVPVCNPTDQMIFPKWTCPGSTYAPAELFIPGIPWLGAPKSRATIWTIPDYSFKDDEDKNRRVTLPALIGGLRTNEVQTFYVDGRCTGGTFTLSLESDHGVETIINPLPYNATAPQVQTALVTLAHIAAGDVQVTRLNKVNEVQTIEVQGGATGGTFTLSCEGQTTMPLNHNAEPLAVEVALKALPLIGFGDCRVVEDYERNEQQEITLLGDPTAGTFTLTFDGQTTVPIRYNASNFEVANKLARLSNIGPFDIRVTGSPPFKGGGPWVVEFIGSLKGSAINPMTGDGGMLTGGHGTAVKVKELRQGGKRYRVTFANTLGGDNVGQITGDASKLTGGVDNKIVCETVEDGAWPYRVEFVGNLSGKPQNLLVGDPKGLTNAPNAPVPDIKVSRVQAGKTYPAENAYVDSDPRVEQVVSESGSQLWARMGGVRLMHHIPAYTGKHTFTIDVTGCVPGQSVALHLPRPWSRPWGLEQ